MERVADRSEAALAHTQALLAALDNDPKKWTYEGEVIDFGAGADKHCACGHAIRYGHPLHHVDNPSRIVILGCVCVEHYALIDPVTAARMVADFAAFKERIAEQKRAALKMERETALAILLEEYEATKTRLYAKKRWYIDEYGWGHIPRELYGFHIPKRRAFKSLPAALKYYRKAIDATKEVLGG
jgi:hypothetical protein